MNGKSDKKLTGYLLAYLAFAVLFSGFLFFVWHYHTVNEQQRVLFLLAEHPELETEVIGLWEKYDQQNFAELTITDEMITAMETLEEKYGYRLKYAPNRTFWGFWCAGMLLGAAMTAVLGYFDWRRRRKSDLFREQIRQLGECLAQFQRGEFGKIPEFDNASEEWMQLGERLKELGLYFAALKKRLKEEEDSTKALITDISHQLKTPLASLRMSYELITGDAFTEDEQREFQAQGEKEMQKLEELLDELVNLSRLEAHMITLKPVSASLKETITEAVSQIYMKARQKDIAVGVEMEMDFTVCHDVKWTTEALANVLENAVKYSEAHTAVTVRVTPLAKNVLIAVEDEGMGIDKEEIARIYQRFYRGTRAKELVKEGAGVGLYLTRMILERQGGTISAKRKANRGTVFQMTLPR